MTRQETFDHAVLALRRQGRPSIGVIDGKPCCMYRRVAEDGTVLKCTAGHLISDAEYKPEFEGNAYWTIEKNIHQGRVGALQRAHDDAAATWPSGKIIDPTTWVERFLVAATAVAWHYGLDKGSLTADLEGV